MIAIYHEDWQMSVVAADTRLGIFFAGSVPVVTCIHAVQTLFDIAKCTGIEHPRVCVYHKKPLIDPISAQFKDVLTDLRIAVKSERFPVLRENDYPTLPPITIHPDVILPTQTFRALAYLAYSNGIRQQKAAKEAAPARYTSPIEKGSFRSRF